MLVQLYSNIAFFVVAQIAANPSLTDLYNKSYLWLASRGPKLLIAIVVFLVGIWFIRFIRNRMTLRMARQEVHSSLQPFFLSLTITAMHIVLIIVVMEIMDLELTIFTAILSAATVAAGLALSGTLQNFAGGVMILLLKPFDIGDNIIAQGQDGKVTSIQIFYTVVLTFDNKTVIIPNGKLFNEVIVNVSREGRRRLDIEIKLGFAADPEEVIKTLKQSVDATANILITPAKNVGISQIEFDGIKFSVQVWVQPGNFGTAKMQLHERILKDLRAAGVPLPGV